MQNGAQLQTSLHHLNQSSAQAEEKIQGVWRRLLELREELTQQNECILQLRQEAGTLHQNQEEIVEEIGRARSEIGALSQQTHQQEEAYHQLKRASRKTSRRFRGYGI